MLFLETVKRICGDNKNLYEAIVSLYNDDPENFAHTFADELFALVSRAYDNGELEKVFTDDGLQLNVLGADVRIIVGKQPHVVVYNPAYGGVRNDSIVINLSEALSSICAVEGERYELKRDDAAYRNEIAFESFEKSKPKIIEQLLKKLPKYSVRRNVYDA